MVNIGIYSEAGIRELPLSPNMGTPRYGSKPISQSLPIPGQNMVRNEAGGYGYQVDDWQQFLRFITLGTTQKTIYASAKEQTTYNVDAIDRLIKAGRGKKMVDALVRVSQNGDALSNDPALFALARLGSYMVGNTHRNVAEWVELRKYALSDEVVRQVVRTGTHLFHFIQFAKAHRGWGTLFKRAIANWYNDKPADRLAYQLLKYQQRDGVGTHRDFVILSHPKPSDDLHNIEYQWLLGKDWNTYLNEQLQQIWAYEKLKRLRPDEVFEACHLIRAYRLTFEMVPTHFHKEQDIWLALLQDMPLTALLRNLARLTRLGVITQKGSNNNDWICTQLTDACYIRKRPPVHPMQILQAFITYSSGKSEKSGEHWTPNDAVTKALEKAFYLSYGNVTPTNQVRALGVDVSASMTRNFINGNKSFPVHLACAAMALVVINSEPHARVIGIDTCVHDLGIERDMGLFPLVERLKGFQGGGTDCSLLAQYAQAQHLQADSLELWTDNESWFGNIHTMQAVYQYRTSAWGKPTTKVVNIQTSPSRTTSHDPLDRHALEVVGYGPSVMQQVQAFLTMPTE